MAIREGFQRVLNEYAAARTEPLAGHPLAQFLVHALPTQMRESATKDPQLRFSGSAGKGNWARGPWLAIFHPDAASGAQSGLYPCFLFREDLAGVFLSLNQGVTEIKAHFKSGAKNVLRAKAQMYRETLGSRATSFALSKIDLAPSGHENVTAYYEAGNICATYYAANQLPSEAVLIQDLDRMLALYALLRDVKDVVSEPVEEDDAPVNLVQEDATRFRTHKRIERKPSISKQVKEAKGYRCEVCNLCFIERYGEIGKKFIEAHHLVPLASLKGTKSLVDPAKDFAVLCSNCHRMVHRSGVLSDMQQFKREHFHE